MQLRNRILFGTVEDKELSFTRFFKEPKRIQKKSRNFSKKFQFKNKKFGDFASYQKQQYKKFFVSRNNYVESIHVSKIFKFKKIKHLLFLVFCTYFFGLRFVSSYDWFY